MASARLRPLGLWSGVGLVVANMVGVGVLTNIGYEAQELRPREILLAWLVGGVMAMAGAVCYAHLARIIPRSGGEYRYLSDLLHPFAGYLAGWTSLVVGFAAPIAVAASTAGPFVATVVPRASPTLFAAVLIIVVTALQAFDLTLGKTTQDVLALLKGLLVVVFLVVGLALGARGLPTWSPPHPSATGFPLGAFTVSLVYVAFAYSGWNTAVYAAEEFVEPRRTVPRAMLLGTALVTLAYLLVNFVFVANLDAARLGAWLGGDTARITVGHVLMETIAGPRAATAMSIFVVVALFSSVSSMTMVGPRVYAAMARQGFLPGALAGREGRPPLASVLLQSGLALALLLTHRFEELLRNVGSILTLMSLLTVLALLRVRFGRTGHERPSTAIVACALVYLAGSAWMLWFAIRGSRSTVLWMTSVAVLAAVGYGVARRPRP